MILIFFLLLTLIGNAESSAVKPCSSYTCDDHADFEDDVSGSGNDKETIPCCSCGNYSFYSIVDALNNVTSNTVMKVSTDVVLSSNVLLVSLSNIAIIGQGNPTVNYIASGSVKFVSCFNITIEGIIWKGSGSRGHHTIYASDYYYYIPFSGSGSDNENLLPGVEVQHSSNITIQNCLFNDAASQAVLLSNVSGNVHVSNCQFTDNKYNGHGVALSFPAQSTEAQLTINNCNFSSNGYSQSVVYIKNSNRSNHPSLLLQGSTFLNNQGVPIYIVQTSLILNNSVLFRNNRATNGGGIYSSNSTIIFDFKCNVTFMSNLVSSDGGAIYQTFSKIFFRMNATVMFIRNSKIKVDLIDYDSRSGGAVHSYYSIISFEDWSITTFDGNHKGGLGGGVYAKNSIINASGSSRVNFTRNYVYSEGAGICAHNSHITFMPALK